VSLQLQLRAASGSGSGAPAITTQPQSQFAPAGATVTLSVTASGNPAPQYKWSLNGDYIPGATGATLTLAKVQGADAGSFQVTVYNDYGSVESEVAEVIVDVPLLPLADNFSARGGITGFSGSGRGSNLGASKESGEPRHADKNGGASVWLSWTAPASGIATFSTDGSALDTLLGVYTGSAVNSLTKLASDDESGGYHTSVVKFNAEAGARYEIAIDGESRQTGTVVFNWSLAPTESRIPVITQPPQDTTVSLGGAAELSVSFVSSGPVAVQWYRNGQALKGATESILALANLSATHVGQYLARLKVGNEEVFSQPAELQINTEGWLTASAENKQADAASASTSASSTTKSLRAGTLSKARRFKSLDPVRGYTGTQIFATAPGKDPDEPNHCGVVGGASYWLSYQPPESGLLRLNTDGSSFDTILAVYVDNGTNLGYDSLVSLACDNNSGMDGKDSATALEVTANTVYYIVVDGVNGACGTVYLNYDLNVFPAVSALAAQTIAEDTTSPTQSFTISDRETAATSLLVGCRSSNPTLVPVANITLGGSGSSRSISVRPARNQHGNTTIFIDVTDAGGATTTRSFSVTVTPVNDAPVASDDTRYLNGATKFYIYIPGILSNDSDVDGNTLSLASYTQSYLNGSVSKSGSYLVYTRPSSWTGSDFFQYTISDGNGGSATGRVYLY
jgi:hypothetical protein